MSPDGKHLILIGDGNQAHLYGIGNDNDQYTLIERIECAKDACFSASWNEASTVFAVASQDGTVGVWDVRKMASHHDKKSSTSSSNRCLAMIPSNQQKAQKGACRTVKFSRTNAVDLLAFTEHVSYVSVVDARTFGGRQSLRVGPSGSETHLSGLAWSPDSQSLFVSSELHTHEFEVDVILRRMFPTHEFA